jgi:hypothetical protein
MQPQEHQVPSRPSQLELELQCRLLEIDTRIEISRCEEYRRLMLAMAAGGHPGQLLPPVPDPAPRPELMPVPVGGFSSESMTPGTAIPGPLGAVVATAARCTQAVSPNLLAPSSSSSQLSYGSSESGRGRGHGRSGRVRGGCADTVASASPVRRRLLIVLILFLLTPSYPLSYRLRRGCNAIPSHSMVMTNHVPPLQTHQYPGETLEGTTAGQVTLQQMH